LPKSQGFARGGNWRKAGGARGARSRFAVYHHELVSAKDFVVMIASILYQHLPPDSGMEPKEAVSRVLGVIETPLAVEIYDQEMQGRQPRGADRWH
jgi:hypothetical protein